MLNKTEKLTHSESGKLGALASKEYCREKRLANEQKYLLNPIHCKQCLLMLSYHDKQRKKVFCSRSCAATYNNTQKVKKQVLFKCLSCAAEIIKSRQTQNKYCTAKCQKDYEYKEAIKNWEIVAPGKSRIKKYLAETFGRKCSVCSIEEWNGKEIVFDLEHKDGNSENNNKINLCLICPNCHSQTDSYKGANRGNGRHSRRQRYAEGKSF